MIGLICFSYYLEVFSKDNVSVEAVSWSYGVCNVTNNQFFNVCTLVMNLFDQTKAKFSILSDKSKFRTQMFFTLECLKYKYCNIEQPWQILSSI